MEQDEQDDCAQPQLWEERKWETLVVASHFVRHDHGLRASGAPGEYPMNDQARLAAGTVLVIYGYDPSPLPPIR